MQGMCNDVSTQPTKMARSQAGGSVRMLLPNLVIPIIVGTLGAIITRFENFVTEGDIEMSVEQGQKTL